MTCFLKTCILCNHLKNRMLLHCNLHIAWNICLENITYREKERKKRVRRKTSRMRIQGRIKRVRRKTSRECVSFISPLQIKCHSTPLCEFPLSLVLLEMGPPGSKRKYLSLYSWKHIKYCLLWKDFKTTYIEQNKRSHNLGT